MSHKKSSMSVCVMNDARERSRRCFLTCPARFTASRAVQHRETTSSNLWLAPGIFRRPWGVWEASWDSFCAVIWVIHSDIIWFDSSFQAAQDMLYALRNMFMRPILSRFSIPCLFHHWLDCALYASASTNSSPTSSNGDFIQWETKEMALLLWRV